MENKKKIIYGIIAFFALTLFAFASWLVTDETITMTSDAEFCVSCHSMEPFEAAHRADIHGGMNAHGVRATCADCHLPHDSSFNYLYVKARTGLHDLWVENFGDPSSVNWEANRLHREEYTYDSGCMTCHTNLEQATMATNKAFIAHKNYFLSTTDDKCTTCHQNVGHKDLSEYISAHDF
jgi:cytochrome c-type protein NapC